MNDSLMDELEHGEHDDMSSTPYQPLLASHTSERSSIEGPSIPAPIYSPGRQAGEADVWAELDEGHSRHSSSLAASSNASGTKLPHRDGEHVHQSNVTSIKDQIFNTIAEKSRSLRTTGSEISAKLANRNNWPKNAQLRKNEMPVGSGFNIFHTEGGGNVPDDRGNIANLDSFFTSLYNYYYHKGWTNIVVTGLVDLFNLIFTIILSTFLLGCVDWSALASCNADELNIGCNNPLSTYVSCSAHWGMYKVMIFFYFCIFICYWIWSLLGFFTNLRDSNEMFSFYKDRLHIDTRRLQTMHWNEVVERVIDLSKSTNHFNKIHLNNQKLSPHDIASRIMRKENYLIGMLNMNALDLHLPTVPFLKSKASKAFFARNMEWNLHLCLLNHMFDDNYIVQNNFLKDVEGLKKRFLIAGIINFFMVPYVLIFMIMHFFLKYTQEWRSRNSYLGPRQWSPLALWKFREFNELPHVFDKRIDTSYSVASKYPEKFPVSALSVIARGVSFVTGSLLAVLLIFSLVEEALLLEVHLFNRQLMWYVTVLTVLFAAARSFVPKQQENPEEPEEIMLLISSHTHFFPSKWKGKCHTFDVRDDFYALFQYKTQVFLEGCLSVIITPIILCFSLPESASQILQFLAENTVYVEDMGSVCRQSLFDFSKHNTHEEGEAIGQETVQGKMEKSFINFRENHPNWHGSAEGEAMIIRLEAFKGEQESIALEKSIASLASGISSRMATTRSGIFGRAYSASNGEENKSDLDDSPSTIFGQDSMSISQQLLQSQAIQAALGSNQNENNFYWLEKYYQAQSEGGSKL